MKHYFSPAKINLFLAVTGKRKDGFHDLVSLVAPLSFGDRIEIGFNESGEDFLECSNEGLSTSLDNTIIKALKLFRETYSFDQGVTVQLDKQIPMGAGLGGGSSNATIFLKGLNELLGSPLEEGSLIDLLGQVGSDCPLFMYGRPVVMRGRGEKIEVIEEFSASDLKILLFKPFFSVNTGWAYQAMQESGTNYLIEEEAELCLKRFREMLTVPPHMALEPYNNFEPIIASKYIAIGVLLDKIRTAYSVPCGMSGSGSACFALLDKAFDVGSLKTFIRESWGVETFIKEATFL